MWWLKNIYAVDPSGSCGKRDILIREGKIEANAERLSPEEVAERAGGEPVESLNGEGKYLFPGFIDAHTHLREPGQEAKEDIASGAAAAVKGGFTSIIAMANTEPPVDSRGLVEFVRTQGARAGLARVYPLGTVTKGMRGRELVEMLDLKEGGAVGFSDDGHNLQNSEVMRLALEYAKLTGLPIVSHSEDENLACGGAMHRGKAAARLGLKGIPSSAESIMVARDLMLAAETGGKIHLAHISCRESVRLIREAKERGLDVSAEVNPHHLLFTDRDVDLFNTSLKVNPPLRSEEDQEALLTGLLDGTLDMLATDHAPHVWEEKARPFAEAPFGIIGLETALAAVWQRLVVPGKLSPKRLAEVWSLAPARRFGLPGGTLRPGSPADLVLFDPEWRERITSDSLASKAQNTPFLGQELQGFPTLVWVGGEPVLRGRQLCPAGDGVRHR
ncbi:dihydroorotase [Acididesulfobacillus acetoxydans]|uniref:Dihydroorotase n=1 Tax=Acididesulfobacillus acetoxydans TaxID=1561005 RepID=A0A8S0W549_9FIRM|nr:dihydroorotase [Acididesulfobacillus acetoxydans]CAA7602848.1 dihydroorotase [Acididesulfobacillus acetoxydans]CEJ05729.1 Dihydroorotase [Acididesulfobacillus acetoxydans]